jgi:hypothetical protein
MSWVASEVLEEFQLKCLPCCNWSALLSCNSFDTNNKNYISRVAIGVLEEMQLRCLRSCNWGACGDEIKKECPWHGQRDWGLWGHAPRKTHVCRRRRVAPMQLIYTPSCKYWVLPPDAIIPLQLQLNSGLSCNWYTLRVANTKCFRMIQYYPFSCNWTVVQSAIDAHSEL